MCLPTAKSSLCDFEVLCGLSDNGKDTARTFSFLYALSKATSYGHEYQKAGVALHWTSYLKSISAKNKVCMKGMNVIFVLGGAAFYHRHHLTFVKEKVPHCN